ncbi:MAG: diguanylate cyclase [Erysipelotrichaceae bacterium]
MSGSIGIAMYPKDGTSFVELYERGDKALYNAKRNGKSQVVFYNEH